MTVGTPRTGMTVGTPRTGTTVGTPRTGTTVGIRVVLVEPISMLRTVTPPAARIGTSTGNTIITGNNESGNKQLDTAGVLLPLMLPLMLLQVPCHSWAELGHSTCHHQWE